MYHSITLTNYFSEFATRYSESCCTRLIENNGMAVSILANLAERCNRSLPHMEVVSTICDIFINISELLETRNFIASCDKFKSILEVIFTLMNRFKENKKPLYIFSKCCSLLWKLSHHDNVLQVRQNKDKGKGDNVFTLNQFVNHSLFTHTSES